MVPTTSTSPWGRRMAADREEILAEAKDWHICARGTREDFREIVARAAQTGAANVRCQNDEFAQDFRHRLVNILLYRGYAGRFKTRVYGNCVRLKIKPPQEE